MIPAVELPSDVIGTTRLAQPRSAESGEWGSVEKEPVPGSPRNAMEIDPVSPNSSVR